MANSTACQREHGSRLKTRRTLLAAQLRRVHRLAHDLQTQALRVLERQILLVVLLEQRRGGRVVRADTRRLPARVVPGRIGLIQLEAVQWVPADVQ